MEENSAFDPKPYCDLSAESPLHLKEALHKGLSSLSNLTLDNLILERIRAGESTAQLYRFSIENEMFVLRILDPKGCGNPSVNFGKRKNEIHAHQIASKLRIAPELVYHDPKYLITLMRYIPGRALCHEDLQERIRLENLAEALKRLHSTPHRLSVQKTQLNRIKTHYNQAKSKGVAFPSCFTELFDRFARQAQKHRSADLTLNHGDLHPSNILLTNDHCFLIDWAYASADYDLSDIAYLTILSGMDRVQTFSFYNSYLGRVSSDHDLELLKQAQSNTCLMLATTLFNLSGTDENLKQPMKERIDRLNSLLESSEVRNIQYYITGTTRIHPRKSKSSDIQLCALAFLKHCIKKEHNLELKGLMS